MYAAAASALTGNMARAQAVVAAHERAVIRVAGRAQRRRARRLRRRLGRALDVYARSVQRGAARKFTGRFHPSPPPLHQNAILFYAKDDRSRQFGTR